VAISGEGGRENVCDSVPTTRGRCHVTEILSTLTCTGIRHPASQADSVGLHISPCHIQTRIHLRPLQQHHLCRDLRTRPFHLPFVPTLHLSHQAPRDLQSHRLRLHDQQPVQLLHPRRPLQNAQKQGQWTCYASTMG